MHLLTVLAFIIATLNLTWCSLDAGFSREKRTIGGQPFKRGTWPWLVLLEATITTDTLFGFIPLKQTHIYCGGSLISNQWILTAAHCFLNNGNEAMRPWNWKARLASVTLKQSLRQRIWDVVGRVINNNNMKQWNEGIDHIIIHPDYNKKSLYNDDIALVKLSKPVPTGKEFRLIQTISLPNNSKESFPNIQQKCITKGWGCKERGGKPAEQAFQIEIPVYANSACSNYYHVKSMDNRICAGYLNRGVGVCNGDSGGPLVCTLGGEYILAGVVSFTSKSHPESFPAVFTKVQHYVSWIKNVMYTNGFG